jgi:hypothetical protein
MTKNLTKAITYVFNPLIIGLTTLVIIVNHYFPQDVLRLVLPLTLALAAGYFGFVGFHYFIRKEKLAHAFYLTNSHELDEFPYIALVFASSAASMVYGSKQLIPNNLMLNIAMLIALFYGSVYLINRYIEKPGLQVAHFAFAIMLLAHHVSLAYALALIVMPVMYWSQLTLKHKNWLQLMLGTIIGCAIGLIGWTF